MGGACGTCGGERTSEHRGLVEKPEGKREF